jgi:hypothetical protein
MTKNSKSMVLMRKAEQMMRIFVVKFTKICFKKNFSHPKIISNKMLPIF